MTCNLLSSKLEKYFLVLACLFSALIVVFQSQRFWYLYDYSFVLENAYRMLHGVPFYRDFLFPYPPGTFLIQTFLIRLFGTTLYPQIVYCCLISIVTYLLTFRILFFFDDSIWLNFALALPIAVTGGYGLVFFPFYDQDSTFFILLAIFFVLYSYQNFFPSLFTFVGGMLVALPSFFKQNTGLAFLILTHLVFVFALVSKRDRIRVKNYLVFVAGTIVCLVFLLIYLQLSSGLENYFYSTFTIPRRTRLPSPAVYLSVFRSFVIIRGIIAWLCAMAILKYLGDRKLLVRLFIVLLIFSPVYLVPLARWILFHKDYFDQFLTIWPIAIVISVITVLYSFYKIPGVPFFHKSFCLLLILLINAALLAQGYTASHFGIWPLLIILFGQLLYLITNSSLAKYALFVRRIFVINSIGLTISLSIMMITNYHLRAVSSFNPGEVINHSVFPALNGLSIPGEQIPNFDNLLTFVKKEIPLDEQIMIIPAEDPFYFGSGRIPKFPLYMYDWTLLLYSPQEVLDKVTQYDVKWMVIKIDLQAKWIVNWRNLNSLLVQLKKEFTLYKTLPGYEIYRKTY